MKTKTYLLFALMLIGVSACDKEGDKLKFLGASSDIALAVSSTSDLVLTQPQASFSSLQFQWTNPTYKFSNGENTQNVTYTLQIDKDGGDFTGSKVGSVEYKSALSVTFNVRDLNTALAAVELPDGQLNTFQFRIKASLTNGPAPVYSNVIKMKIATYLDVVFPVPTNLFMIGNATPAEWDNNVAKLDPSQKFTKINPFTFQLNSIALTGGAYYLLLPVAGSWANKYAFDGTKDKNNLLGDKFKPDDGEDFLGPTTGNYKVTVNFKTAKVSLEKL
jgi:starch-binding outer membrane protein SusE/F